MCPKHAARTLSSDGPGAKATSPTVAGHQGAHRRLPFHGECQASLRRRSALHPWLLSGLQPDSIRPLPHPGPTPNDVPCRPLRVPTDCAAHSRSTTLGTKARLSQSIRCFPALLTEICLTAHSVSPVSLGLKPGRHATVCPCSRFTPCIGRATSVFLIFRMISNGSAGRGWQ